MPPRKPRTVSNRTSRFKVWLIKPPVSVLTEIIIFLWSTDLVLDYKKCTTEYLPPEDKCSSCVMDHLFSTYCDKSCCFWMEIVIITNGLTSDHLQVIHKLILFLLYSNLKFLSIKYRKINYG